MYFSIATVLAASTLLFPPTLAAPLPNDGNRQNGSGSCSPDAVNVGVGIGVGNGIYRPNSNGVKVKQGDQRSCPSGWTRSLLEVDLCIEVGGNDHRNEKKQQYRPDSINRAAHSSQPYWAPATTTTVDRHRASHTSAPQQKDEWTPRGGGNKKSSHATSSTSSVREDYEDSPSPYSRPVVRVAAHTTTTQSSTPSPTGTGCPRGQTRGIGPLIDICVDFDSDPLFLGGGIKLGGLRGPSSSSPTSTPATKDRSGSGTGTRSSSSSPSASPTSTRCSDGTTYDAFLDICIDIDTDPLFLGGGIKIGGSPQRPSSTASFPSRNGSPTSRPSSDRAEQQGSPPRRTNGQDNEADLPDCDGPNDPRAFVDLCVNAGNLLGARIKLGGSGSSPSPSPSASPRSSQSNQNQNKNSNGGDSPRDRNRGSNDNEQENRNRPNLKLGGDNQANDSRPPCNGPEDPNAALDLCVQVGDLLNAGVKLGGSSDPSSSTPSPSSGRNPNNGKSSSPTSNSDDENDGNILDLNVGGLLNAKIGSGPQASSSTTSTSPSYSPTRRVKQTAPINTYHEVDHESSPKSNNRKNTDSNNDDDDAPLAKVIASAQVDVGPSPTPSVRRKTQASPTPQAKEKGCPVGFLLHLGVCVEADVDVPGVVHATAAATAAV